MIAEESILQELDLSEFHLRYIHAGQQTYFQIPPEF